MAQMRALQPEMLKIRERYADDQIWHATRSDWRFTSAKRSIPPPAACRCCIQMPVFFSAAISVLNVTIEMRHAPFYGWIKDLSAADPSNVFTAFGLIPWNTPTWMHLGFLPMLYTLTMIVQTSLQPKPADPVQARMMQWMPYFFLFIFDKMAAGFVLYWTWSNTLSILQQKFITRRHGAKSGPEKGQGGINEHPAMFRQPCHFIAGAPPASNRCRRKRIRR